MADGQYTVLELKDALVTALNTNKAIAGTYAVTYLAANNRLEISIVNPGAGDEFRVWPQEHLEANASAWGLTAATLQSASRPLGFMSGAAPMAGNGSTHVRGAEAPTVQPYHQLFLRSNLGSGSTQALGVNFESNIVRRIVVGNTPANSFIVSEHATSTDCV